jgi:hypothetical protein
MTLGTAGGAPDPGFFYQPNDVLVAPNGDIFVSEGHSGGGRILKFKEGTLIKIIGKAGSGPGQFNVRTRWRWIRAAASSLAIARTTACRFSIRTATSSPSGNSSAAERHLHRSRRRDLRDRLRVAQTSSRPPTATTPASTAASAGAARDGKVVGYIPDPMPSGGRAVPRASRSIGRGTSTGLRSVRAI